MKAKQFLGLYNDVYSAVYQLEGTFIPYETERKYAAVFDDLSAHDPAFNKLLCDCVAERQDYFTSTRECAAFLIAYVNNVDSSLLSTLKSL